MKCNVNRNLYNFIQENDFESVVWKMAAICLDLNMLNLITHSLTLVVVGKI